MQIFGDVISYQNNGKGSATIARETWSCRLNRE
jgi:hypothetical protein